MLVFGNNHSIYLSSGCRFHGGGNIVLDEHDASLIIGRGTTIEDAYIHVIEAHAKVVIGRNCMFSYGIEIRTGDGHGIFDTTKQRLNPPRNVTIGDRVWIGSRAIILKGVEIAEDSVVGSGAVVTKSFAESGVVLAGNPAKVIRRGVRWFYDRSGRF
jgi:acetyltransferase-like isoleucine patch superfamily enzyme